MRAWVERGACELGPFADSTGDVGVLDGKAYSNKPPGQQWLAAPAYFAVHRLERALGADAGSPAAANANAWALTFLTSGLPGAGLVALLFLHFRRRGATEREALLLAGGFGAGTLLLPYSGALFAQPLVAFLLFAAWLLLETAGPRAALGGGAALGLAVCTDFSALPAAALLLLDALRRGRPARPLLAGPALFAGLLLAFDQACFGDPFTTPASLRQELFRDEGLVLGVFGPPSLERLYWLTLHPFRGLFYACPLLLLPLFSLGAERGRGPSPLLPLAVAASFLAFNLCFNGWTGGWGVGPRYLLPATPFLYALALPGARRAPRLAAGLGALSTVFMLAVAATGLMVPAPNGGPPPGSDPVRRALFELAAGRVSSSTQSVLEYVPALSGFDRWDSFNAGEGAGLPGLWSLLPVLLLFAGYLGWASGRRR